MPWKESKGSEGKGAPGGQRAASVVGPNQRNRQKVKRCAEVRVRRKKLNLLKKTLGGRFGSHTLRFWDRKSCARSNWGTREEEWGGMILYT